MTPAQMLHAAGQAFEASRRRGESEADAMDDALREFASCRQRNRSPGARGKVVPLSIAARAVIDAVLEAHGLTVEDVLGAGRTKYHGRIRRARDEAVYLARKVDQDASYPALGALFERDHATLVYGQRVFAKRLASDEVLALRIRRALEAPRTDGVAAIAGGAA